MRQCCMSVIFWRLLTLCAGQDAGNEAVVHATRAIYYDCSTEVVLLIGASNTFNCLNSQVSLHNNYVDLVSSSCYVTFY